MNTRRAIRASGATPGMTLVEVVVSMLIVGFVLASVMQGVGLSVRFQRASSDQSRGVLLARDLADRVGMLPYLDETGAAAIGTEAGEVATDPATLDDVDDFDGYSESPPLLADGSAMVVEGVWERSVSVEFVTLAGLDTVTASDEGVKRITVTITHQGKPVASVVRLRYAEGQLRRE